MSSVKLINPKAEVARASQALSVIIEATNGLKQLLKTNLGPHGTIKMLVSGGGDIKITKDGKCLMHEMQISNPICSLIGRAVTAQDDILGDGTTSTVILICELVHQAGLHIREGVHPQLVTDGLRMARDLLLEDLKTFAVKKPIDRALLVNVARTALGTKISGDLNLSENIVDAVLTIKNEEIDLHMVEIMEMMHQTDSESRLVKGIVLDHAARHPDMPKRLTNAYILSCNVSMEYEKSEVNSGYFYQTAEQRDKMVIAERKYCDDSVNKVIQLKKSVCADGSGFVLINQKGIDPISLDELAKHNIIALRRAKRRNMERIPLACGGYTLNSFDELSKDCLGFAGSVYEMSLGEDKFTFLEDCKSPRSVTLLLKGQNKHTLNQLKDAVRDGLRAVKNTFDDGSLVPGAGAFEVRGAQMLNNAKVPAREKCGVDAFAKALMSIPRTLAANAGHDPHQAVADMIDASTADYSPGLDLWTGAVMDSMAEGVYDNTCVKAHSISSACVMASNLLQVDEIMRAGISSVKSGMQQ